MPTAHRQIAESARAAWQHASALLLIAKMDGGTSRDDFNALADYAAEQRDTWLSASERAQRDEERRRMDSILDALDYGADEFEFGPCDGDDDFGPVGHGDDDFGPASPDDDFGFR